jgi:drug/metabolite transporter (DMT)-like permease
VTAIRPGARPLGSAYIALAALMWSLAGLLQHQLHMNLASQLAGRAAFAFLAVLVFVAVAERGRVLRAFRATGWPGLLVAALMAVASASFITALNDTSVANVLVIQALVPLAAALLGRIAGDPVRRTTWIAMGLAVAGFAVMAGAPSRPGLSGTVFSIITMLTFAATIVVVRHKSDVSMAPATCLSQIIVLAMFAPFAHVGEMGGANLLYLALLGIVQMGMGLFFLSLGARLIPAADVALISQLENVLGPLWVWLAGIERPSAATIAGGIIVIGAVVFQVLSGAPWLLPPSPVALSAQCPVPYVGTGSLLRDELQLFELVPVGYAERDYTDHAASRCQGHPVRELRAYARGRIFIGGYALIGRVDSVHAVAGRVDIGSRAQVLNADFHGDPLLARPRAEAVLGG